MAQTARAKKGTIAQEAECLHCGTKLTKPALTYEWVHELSGALTCPGADAEDTNEDAEKRDLDDGTLDPEDLL